MTSSAIPDLIPARMLNEHVYCPRLAYLEWVDQRFADNADTAEGSYAHQGVDRERGAPPDPTDGEDRPPSTSVTLSSDELGLIAKIDLLEAGGETVTPVEYKRGRPRSADEPLWEPELAQLCAQVLLLRDSGYRVERAEVYFSETRTRHEIEIDEEALAATREAIASLRETAARDEPPPPLVDSPKCPRCSLVGICLPDETNALKDGGAISVRRLIAPDSPATPLYATKPGARLTKRGGRAVLIEDRKEVASRRLIDISHIAVFGNVDVGSALLRACFQQGAPVLWLTAGGWFKGVATGMPEKNVQVRMRQHRAAALGAPALAGAFVAGKIRNARTLIRRNGGAEAKRSLDQLAALGRQAGAERKLESLLGIEGTAARIYFEQLARLVKAAPSISGAFDFESRNRRPATDPFNALLSFVYALLVKDVTVALLATGLDPFVGVYHRPRFGRPALALDLAEEFRPLIGDSVVLRAINNGEVTADDFVSRAGSVALTQTGRRAVIGAYERRMQAELRHPLFQYRTTYRRALEVQARLFASVLLGELPDYRPLTTR